MGIIMRLQELVTKLDYNLMSGSVDTEVTGITPDSRAVVPGGLFIAIKGAMSENNSIPTPINFCFTGAFAFCAFRVREGSIAL